MLKILVAVLFLFSAHPGIAGKGAKCKKGFKSVSCAEVKGAKRDSFCWKGKIDTKKKSLMCKIKDRKRKKSKTVKPKATIDKPKSNPDLENNNLDDLDTDFDY